MDSDRSYTLEDLVRRSSAAVVKLPALAGTPAANLERLAAQAPQDEAGDDSGVLRIWELARPEVAVKVKLKHQNEVNWIRLALDARFQDCRVPTLGAAPACTSCRLSYKGDGIEADI